MEPTVACTRCGCQVSALLDQVLDLPAFTILQCGCGEVAVVVKPTPSAVVVAWARALERHLDSQA